MKDLAIAYRICAKPSKNAPENFSKFACLKSFKEALGNLDVHIWVIMDGCPKSYEEAFTKFWAMDDLTFFHCDRIGNAGTFRKQVEILLEQNESSMVYFAEDDYLYEPNAIEKAMDFILDTKYVYPHFVTCYDHPDYDNALIHPLSFKVPKTNHLKWIERRSTTLTFLTDKSTLRKTKAVFLNRLAETSDFARWLALTKTGMFNPTQLVRWLPHKFLIYSFVTAWLFHWRQIIFGRRYTLFAPSPSLANHMVKNPKYKIMK